jgi:Winged helix DNA-binding domain
MYRMDAAERRRRLAIRHGLVAAGAPDPSVVARQMVALHSTDPATVYLSIRARMPQVTPGGIEESLYERRDLIRMLGMRRTVFVVPAESVPVVQAGATDRIARDQRARLLKLLGQAAAVADPEPWLADLERSVLRVLADHGGTGTAAELAAAEPRLRTTVTLAAGTANEVSQAITSRVLLVLAAHGHIVRGKPVGSWLSQQYRWWLTEHWLPGGPAARSGPAGEADAKAELARQWLRAFGPAPLADLKWWTGWTMTQARQVAAGLGVVEVDLDGVTAVALDDDLGLTADPGDWVALLPALDPTVMGWSDRAWFLGPHGKALFDNTGNAGPTIWAGGRIVGGWAQRGSGEIVVRMLEDVGADATKLIEAEADRLGSWLGGVRVIPRFRTPTERELSA